jgi:hypothetical protein
VVVETVMWFYEVMGHPGEKRLGESLRQCYYHPPLCQHIEQLKGQDYQKYKIQGHGYRLLPKREVCIAPWEEVTIDLIGPWEVKVNSRTVEFNALTCIDTASNLVELIRVDDKTATHIHDKFTYCWLCHYPQPIRCVHDKGCEFISSSFQWLLEMFSIIQSVNGCIKQSAMCYEP